MSTTYYPYTIDFSDPTDTDASKQSFQIQPGQVDTTHTSLELPGKGRIDYGEFYNENLVHILENFSSTVAPPNPTRGQLWYDRGNKTLKVYSDTPTGGLQWFSLMTTTALDRIRVPSVQTLPAASNSAPGDLVFNAVDKNLYLFDGTNWQIIATQLWVQTQAVINCGTIPFDPKP